MLERSMILFTALALAGRSLSSHIVAWCLCRNIWVRPGVVFMTIMMFIALAAGSTGHIVNLASGETGELISSLLLGLGMGLFLILAELITPSFRIIRGADAETILDRQLRSDSLVAHAAGIAHIYVNWSVAQRTALIRPWGLMELSVVAIAEEVLYRGVVCSTYFSIVDVSFSAFVLLIVSCFIFGISHDAFGLRQVLLKTAYGGFLCLSVIVSHVLLSAIIAHLLLNLFSWNVTQRSTRTFNTRIK